MNRTKMNCIKRVHAVGLGLLGTLFLNVSNATISMQTNVKTVVMYANTLKPISFAP